MSLQCPLCNSPKITSLSTAMKIDAAVGTIGGTAPGASSALAGNEFGTAADVITGSLGVTSARFLAHA